MPTAMVLVMAFLAAASGASAAGALSYHVSPRGNDSNPGTSPARAWKTLARVNRQVLRPGDRVLFERGARFAGHLVPQGSGAVLDGNQVPVTIGAFGEGPRPRLDGEGTCRDTILVRNVEFIEVTGLEVTNKGPDRKPGRTGIRLVADGAGPRRHIVLRDLFVHDVNGDLRKDHEGHGILFECLGKGSFDGILIEDCHLLRTDRNGICGVAPGGTRSRNVVIRRNLLEDIGGDGIKPWGCAGALVEHNRLRGGQMRCDDYAAGIWPWDCDDTVIQFNEVSGMRGDRDGEAFDSDGLCRRSLFQYNYSHDNEGGFMLVCATPEDHCEGTVVRYNISQNDGIKSARVFHLGGPVRNTHIYNNTIYVGPNQNLPLLNFTEDEGWPEGTRFTNNLFLVAGRARCEFGRSTNNAFESNVVQGDLGGCPEGVRPAGGSPLLAGPGTGGEGFDSLDGYRLTAAGAKLEGIVVPAAGPRDFFGNPVPPDGPRSIGADQGPPAP